MEIRLSNLSVSLYKVYHYGNIDYQTCLYHYISVYHYGNNDYQTCLHSLYMYHYGNKVIKPVCIII